MSECNHSSYWRGTYNTCMACRAEQAEEKVAQLESECVRLRVELANNQSYASDELKAECERLKTDLESESNSTHDLIMSQGRLLTATVNVIRGQPPELTQWSWHDIVDRAIELKQECERLHQHLTSCESSEADLEMECERLRVDAVRINNYIYYMAYHAGHHDTVEGNYTDVLFVDALTYHDDVVSDLLAQINQVEETK